MFFCPPGIHVDANLGNQSESCRFTNAIDLSQIHAADPKRFLSNIEFHVIASLYLRLTGGFEVVRLCLCLQTPDMLRNLLIAFDDLLLVVVKRLQRLLQRKQVFGRWAICAPRPTRLNGLRAVEGARRTDLQIREFPVYLSWKSDQSRNS